MNSDKCAKRVDRHLKGKYVERYRNRETGVYINRKFLTELKKKFGRGDSKLAKVAKLKKVEQESKTMEKFVQEFRRIARKSRYKEKYW